MFVTPRCTPSTCGLSPRPAATLTVFPSLSERFSGARKAFSPLDTVQDMFYNTTVPSTCGLSPRPADTLSVSRSLSVFLRRSQGVRLEPGRFDPVHHLPALRAVLHHERPLRLHLQRVPGDGPRAGWLHCFSSHPDSSMLTHPALCTSSSSLR